MTSADARDGSVRGAGSSDPVEGRPGTASPAGPPIPFAERVARRLAEVLESDRPAAGVELVRQAIAVREEVLLRQYRRAIQAERDYQAALHERAGSKYGAERRQRAIDVAARRRDQAEKELGL